MNKIVNINVQCKSRPAAMEEEAMEEKAMEEKAMEEKAMEEKAMKEKVKREMKTSRVLLFSIKIVYYGFTHVFVVVVVVV